MSAKCETCKDERRVDVLDVWSIQRAAIENDGKFPNYDSFDAFPMLTGAIACPSCCPDDPDDMEALTKRLGDPWDPETYPATKQ